MPAKHYFLIVLGAFVTLEACSRLERQALFESTHRPLFKLAMFRKHGTVDALFLGTSRTGEALRPNAFMAVAPSGIKNAFNCSVQYSSLDILADVTKRIMAAKMGPKLAIIEVSRQQLVRAPLPWVEVPAPPTTDPEDQAANWLAEHSELMRLRKAYVLDSLARYVGVALFATQFDGSEQYGIDYVNALIGRRRALPKAEPVALAAAVYEGGDPAVPAELDGELQLYKQIADTLKPARVIFYVPPQRGGDAPPDAQAQLYRAIAAQTQAPLYDFSAALLPDEDFRDATHMSHQGGLRFSREFAKLLELHAL